MRDIELWEAVALSLNLEPDELPVYLGAYDKLGDDPFRICPQLFLERLLVANSNCGISLGFRPVHKLKARCLVDLPDFAAWAVKLNISNMPPELVAMAATEPKAAPDTEDPARRDFMACMKEDIQHSPAYLAEQARYYREVEDELKKEIKEWGTATPATVAEKKEKAGTVAALKAKLDVTTAEALSWESQQPAQAQRPAKPGPVVPSSDGPAQKPRRTKRLTWEDVALTYVVGIYKAGQYAKAKDFYQALKNKAGPDSPFDVGTGENRGSLFVREINRVLILKTLENAMPRIRSLAK